MKDKLPTAGDDKILILSLNRVVSNKKKSSILEISQHPDETEGLTLKDELFKEVFKALEVLDRDQLVRSAMHSLENES